MDRLFVFRDNMDARQLFLKHIGQTSPAPPMTEVQSAEGIYIKDVDDKNYIDLTSGFSVTNIGHRHPAVLDAVKQQLDSYLYTTVYGEHIQTPQLKYAKLLTSLLPDNLETVYFVNSGSEAIEGAMKLAKRYTGKSNFVSAKHAYHGSTQGAMSLKSDAYFTQKYRPLLPGVLHLEYNSREFIEAIDKNTAGVVIEVIQAEAGVVKADKVWLQQVRNKCNETGTQLIFDEIQTGFGRTGKLFAFEHYGVVPDVLCIAKGMGGGMPIGAFISSRDKMYTLADNPILGHITTFGGHPVSCSAAIATLEVLKKESDWINNAEQTAEYISSKIQSHPIVKEVRYSGLLLCVDIDPKYDVRNLFEISLQNGIITDGFLFNPHGYRIAPPLCIDLEQVELVIEKVLGIFNQVL